MAVSTILKIFMQAVMLLAPLARQFLASSNRAPGERADLVRQWVRQEQMQGSRASRTEAQRSTREPQATASAHPRTNPLLPYFRRAFPGSHFDQHYHILVTGPQNSGKTSLVCLLRHFFRDMYEGKPMEVSFALADDAFRVEDGPTTENDHREPTPYRFGTVVVWDLPGAGTPSQPMDGYVDRVGLHFASHVVVTVGQSESEAVSRVVQQMAADRIPATIAQTHIDAIVEEKERSWSFWHGKNNEGFQFDMQHAAIDRLQHVRDTYDLNPRHYNVFAVNLAMFMTDENDPRLQREPYELFAMLSAIMHETHDAHVCRRPTTGHSSIDVPSSSQALPASVASSASA